MWDTDVCTNLIEGTPWIKHFAKHSQTGSVHSVMKSLPASGTLLWPPGATESQEGVGEGGGPELGGDQTPPDPGIRQGSQSLGGLPVDPHQLGLPVDPHQLGPQRDRTWKGWDGSKQHLLPQVGNCSPAGVSNRQVSPCPPGFGSNLQASLPVWLRASYPPMWD